MCVCEILNFNYYIVIFYPPPSRHPPIPTCQLKLKDSRFSKICKNHFLFSLTLLMEILSLSLTLPSKSMKNCVSVIHCIRCCNDYCTAGTSTRSCMAYMARMGCKARLCYSKTALVVTWIISNQISYVVIVVSGTVVSSIGTVVSSIGTVVSASSSVEINRRK